MIAISTYDSVYDKIFTSNPAELEPITTYEGQFTLYHPATAIYGAINTYIKQLNFDKITTRSCKAAINYVAKIHNDCSTAQGKRRAAGKPALLNAHSWDGEPIPHAPINFCLGAIDDNNRFEKFTSKSQFRACCVKAEMLIFVYYYCYSNKSKINNYDNVITTIHTIFTYARKYMMNNVDPESEDAKTIAGIKYVIALADGFTSLYDSSKHPRRYPKSAAGYINACKLATSGCAVGLSNMGVGYDNMYDFGSWFATHDEFLSHIQSAPKSPFIIDKDKPKNTLFYIPGEVSDVARKCQFDMYKAMAIIVDYTSVNINDLCQCIANSENYTLQSIHRGGPYVPTIPLFKTDAEADKFVTDLQVPEKFVGALYVAVMSHENKELRYVFKGLYE